MMSKESDNEELSLFFMDKIKSHCLEFPVYADV